MAPIQLTNTDQIWAIVGNSDSGHSPLLQTLNSRQAELVSFRHQFRNLSNTADFYYQQRFNSFDSEDAPTVEQHLSSARTNHGFWTFEKVVETFALVPLLDKQLIKLSNGETKRLLLATALIRNPEILLLDHPLTGLDAATRMNFNDLLVNISRSGIHVVIATGPLDIPEAVTHLIAITDGKVIYQSGKSTFDPKKSGLIRDVQIDSTALKQLLSAHTPATYNTIIGMTGVTIKYGSKTILENINWTVKQGERWSLSGPNGAGKSTLLSLVNGDNPQAYANDIVLFDRKRGSGESIWDIKKKTGFVSPELYQYFPTDLSCLQVMESGFYDTIGLFRPSNVHNEKICLNWMELMQIQKYARTLFSRVPSSVQRLCLLARALVKNPPLLILDEPTQGLDNHQQQFFTRLIEELGTFGQTTYVYVSHYQQHIPNNITHSLLLNEGRIV